MGLARLTRWQSPRAPLQDTWRPGVSVALLLLLPGVILAQPAPPASADQDIEQIEITGQRSTISLRAEIRNLEKEMFELFNDLNSTNDFDVTCADRIPTGSKLPIWQCEVAYLRKAEMQETQNFVQLGILPRTRQQLAFAHRDKQQRLNDEMKALALEHPALASAMLTLHARRQQLDEMERQRREQHGVGRLFEDGGDNDQAK